MEEEDALPLPQECADSHPRDTIRSPELWLFFLAILPGAGAGLMTINNLGQIVSSRGGAKIASNAERLPQGPGPSENRECWRWPCEGYPAVLLGQDRRARR